MSDINKISGTSTANLLKQKDKIEKFLKKIKTTIVSDIISGEKLEEIKIFPPEFNVELKKQIIHFKKNDAPQFIIHYINNEESDPMIQGFHEAGLLNRKEDKVKVIAYPVYLNGADGLFDLNYYDAIMGTHLGIFPSYYEPWGYTPLETAALGVPAVTTDLAGFGRFINQAPKDDDEKGGIYVLDRYGKSNEEEVSSFTTMLYDYTTLRQRDRVSQKLIAKKLSELADWKELIKNYIDAHNQALEK